MDYQQIQHTFEPIYNEESKILILGTFPSVKSRANGFYYGHPQNRFWKVIASITDSEVPDTIEEKKNLLQRNHIAIWDVIAECEIIGSSDSSIRNVVPNDIKHILDNSQIHSIYANGTKAYELYMRYTFAATNKEMIQLPSSSPANARYSLEALCREWKRIIDFD